MQTWTRLDWTDDPTARLKLKSPSAARRTRAGTTSSPRCTPQTVADLRELTRSGQGIDPLKDFSEAARRELNAFAMV